MLDVYAAWIDGSQVEVDLEAIRIAMKRALVRWRTLLMLIGSPTCSRQYPEFGTGLAVEPRQNGLSCGMRRIVCGKVGTRKLDRES
jgi:hypothetical protein